MPNYNEYESGGMARQKDLILAPNEYCFVQSKTNGMVKTHTGPIMLTISQQEALVIFDNKTKQFKEVTDFEKAKQLFVSAPENWYAILKNPTDNETYPEAGKASAGPNLQIGRKINLRGPMSFALYPGQMAKVIRGHALHTNQYLLARVYEAEAASQSVGEILDTEGNRVENKETYVNGQLLVIKGTEVSFYIPPTGIEVIPIDNNPDKGYVRDAVTLERLEYCILKDENGSKTYTHGPQVVFPKPTETFVISPKGGFIFKAIELSKISGIYVKVIAEYEDEDGTVHPIGEELFITGDDQMIYYPRPEHAVINYDNKMLHHAIAIPEGEGRYIMNRLTGEINTVKGPKMYLPDPRTEVVVKRKLTESQCRLWYPGNTEVLQYNSGLTEKKVEKGLGVVDSITAYAASTSAYTSLANLEANANISRGTSYTKPRTITLDNKYDGVVTIDVWTGYAVNVISKNGDRKVVCGPQTILLDYDQTLGVLELSTGKPKTTNNLQRSVYLAHENNKISDLIEIETKDFVKAIVKVSYCVDFVASHKDKWFTIENYVKYLCDRMRSLVRRTAKNYNIEEFYQKYSDIVRDVVLDTESTEHKGRFFNENGMLVHDVEVLGIDVESDIEDLLLEHQHEMIEQSLKLTDAEKAIAVAEKLAEVEQKQQELRSKELLNKMELQGEEAKRRAEIQAMVNRKAEAEEQAKKQAELDLQKTIDAIHLATVARKDQEAEARRKQIEEDNKLAEAHERALADIEKAKQKAYADTVAQIMGSITPGLIEALQSGSKADIIKAVTTNMSPYAIAGDDESASEVTQRLLRGTGLEEVIKGVNINV